MCWGVPGEFQIVDETKLSLDETKLRSNIWKGAPVESI